MKKRSRGRPRKIEGSIKLWQLGRQARVTCAYDESRGKGEKHSVAVKEAADAVRQCRPEVPISETGVKRILSTVRPRGSRTILRFERAPLVEEDIKKLRLIVEQVPDLQEKNDVTLAEPWVYNETRRREKFLIRFSERPDYPRHNRKTSNQ